MNYFKKHWFQFWIFIYFIITFIMDFIDIHINKNSEAMARLHYDTIFFMLYAGVIDYLGDIKE